ncbi:hypothetical protein [Streptomyces cremeus]|uniref:Regulatory protein n=1 Tax=Streptomyces cremeus TaxID=66881 RepID=A0ABV5P9V3_STRCM
MRQFPVDTSAATVMVAKPPETKMKDRRTGEIAVDSQTGAQMMTLGVVFAANGETDMMTVSVPQTGVSDDLPMGTLVSLTGLVAVPWENEFGGQKRHGIAFRCVAITPAHLPATSNGKG